MTDGSSQGALFRWRGPGGYREVLSLALPLVISTGAHSIQLFTDSVFLSWYSPDAMASSMPAGLWSFTFISFFMGTASYVNTFVAQYHGARRPERIGPSLWQGIYFAIFSAFSILLFALPARHLFACIGHSPELQEMEVLYFRILCVSGGFPVLAHTMASFFIGRGKTRIVMVVTVCTTAVNVVFNYLWIFGKGGFPEMGLTGAALATAVAGAVNALLFALLVFSPGNRARFNTWKGRAFDPQLFRRLMRFGIPNGVQFTIDISIFTLFVSIVGRLGDAQLAASVMAFRINVLAFMPMIGFAIATSTLVGQRLGEDRPDLAARSVWTVLSLTASYILCVASLYVFVPDIFIVPFQKFAEAPGRIAALAPLVRTLLKFVAFYSIFDTLNLVFAGALKGAGDTRFVMVVVTSLGFGLLVVPTIYVVNRGIGGIYAPWAIFGLYVSLLGFTFLFRFLGGKWRHMRVIEPAPAVPSDPVHPDSDAL